MSTQKVRKLTRTLSYTATWATNVLTVTTPTHYLKNGDLVSFQFNDAPQELVNAAVTVTGTTTFTIALTDPGKVAASGNIVVSYFSVGQTGDQSTFSIDKTMDAPTVIQFTAHGTGGAVIVLSVSNDESGWISIATITLASSDLATDFVSIAPLWAKAKLTITSIGASTTVVVTVAS